MVMAGLPPSGLGSSLPPLRGLDIVEGTAAFRDLEDGISEDFLRHYCDTEDLSTVENLDFTVDAVMQGVESLGLHLPNLRQLRLTDSTVGCIRDLGTSLVALEILWMSRAGLQDLSGITAMPNLKECYLPFNDIVDVSPLYFHESLEVLDLEGNGIESVSEVVQLSTCLKLREMTMNANPVSKVDGYRLAVLDAIPTLEVLDDCDRDGDPEALLNLGDLPANLDVLGIDLGAFDEPTKFRNLPVPRDHLGFEMAAYDEDSDDEAFAGEKASTQASTATTPVQSSILGLKNIGKAQSLMAAPKDQSVFKMKATDADWERSKGLYSFEPDESDLILEGLKRSRPTASGHAYTARPATSSARFGFHLADRRAAMRTAHSEPSSYRPPNQLDFDSFGTSEESSSASALTCSDTALGGNPLNVARLRRTQPTRGDRDQDLGIRSLLTRYQTYSQASCLSSSELKERRLQSEMRRPGTPDVRIHSMPDGRSLTSCGRSTSCGRPTSGGRPLSGGSGGHATLSRSGTKTPKRPSSHEEHERTQVPIPEPTIVGDSEMLALDDAMAALQAAMALAGPDQPVDLS